jgi:hypothetical protein
VSLAAGSWTLGWDSLAVFATVVLAGVTAWMALETRRVAGRTEEEVRAVGRQADSISDQAVAAREQVELSRASLEAPIRPVLADVQRPTTRPEGLPQLELARHGRTAKRADDRLLRL